MTDRNSPGLADTEKTLDGAWLVNLAGQSALQYLGLVIALGAVAVMATFRMPPWGPVAWIMVVTVFMIAAYRYVFWAPTDNEELQHKRSRVVAYIARFQGILCAVPVLFFPYFTAAEQAVTSMIVTSLVAGQLLGTSGYPSNMNSHIFIPMTGLVLAWLLWGNISDPPWANQTTAAVMLGAIIFLYGFKRHAYRLFTQSFHFRLQADESNQQLQQALISAESANLAKTRFLASASHDLRQPIHTLSIYSAALHLKKLEPDVREITENMDMALQNLASQLDSLLDISKLDAGVVEATFSNINLASLLERLENEWLPLCEEKHLHFNLKTESNLIVRSDPALLERVLRNLLANAVKYTQHGGITLNTMCKEQHCQLEIIDSGKGIPLSEQERIFEEFYQLDNPGRERSQGLGLGLAIVRRLINLLNLDLTLQSTPGEGTCLSISIPLAYSSVAEPPSDSDIMLNDFKGLRVMVIDDEIAVRNATKILVETMGCEAVIVENTKDALTRARQQLPDIVLADFRLGGNDDGITAIQLLREITPDLPALLVSGDTTPGRLREAHDADIRLLHKPVSIDKLRQALVAELRNK